jgi:hypothetical protein
MVFTRRRWDAWWLGSAAVLTLGGAVSCLLLGRFSAKALAYPITALLLWAWRFRIPREGFPVQTLRELPRADRFFACWCAFSLVGITLLMGVLFAFIPERTHRHYWWVWAAASAAFMAVTLWLARRTDRRRGRGCALEPQICPPRSDDL